VDVSVDEAREHEMAAPDLDDALAVDEYGAVKEDPARGIHGDDDGVLDEDHEALSGQV
jgi:hypothetical protein